MSTVSSRALATVMRMPLRLVGTQQWLRLGIRYRLLALLRSVDLPFRVRFGPYRYAGNLDNYIDRHVFCYGAYERGELELMRRFLGAGSVVLDVGANVGNHSLFFAQYAARVFAFEPFPRLAQRLREQIGLNKIEHVKVMEFGLGENDAHLPYVPPGAYNQGMGSFALASEAASETIHLAVRQGDAVIEQENVSRIDLIKVDVEGFEMEVLGGLRSSIEKYRPVLFVEFSKRTQEKIKGGGGLRSLAPGGYHFYSVTGHRPYLVIFNRGCTLRPADDMYISGNILMVPDEKCSLIRECIA